MYFDIKKQHKKVGILKCSFVELGLFTLVPFSYFKNLYSYSISAGIRASGTKKKYILRLVHIVGYIL